MGFTVGYEVFLQLGLGLTVKFLGLPGIVPLGLRDIFWRVTARSSGRVVYEIFFSILIGLRGITANCGSVGLREILKMVILYISIGVRLTRYFPSDSSIFSTNYQLVTPKSLFCGLRDIATRPS